MDNEEQKVVETGKEEVETTENEGSSKETVEETVKTFTQDEVNEIVQKRLKRALKDHDNELEKARKEATKLAKMNADQKREYELEKATERANAAEKKLARFEMSNTARNLLADADLTVNDDTLELVVTDDADTTQANITKLVAFANTVRDNTLNKVMSGNTPKKNIPNQKHVTAKNVMNDMAMNEITKLYQENPKQFKNIFGGK